MLIIVHFNKFLQFPLWFQSDFIFFHFYSISGLKYSPFTSTSSVLFIRRVGFCVRYKYYFDIINMQVWNKKDIIADLPFLFDALKSRDGKIRKKREEAIHITNLYNFCFLIVCFYCFSQCMYFSYLLQLRLWFVCLHVITLVFLFDSFLNNFNCFIQRCIWINIFLRL